MKSTWPFAILAAIALSSPALAGSVLTPFLSSQVYVQTSYPTYPNPNFPTSAVYQIASDSNSSSFGADITKISTAPGNPQTSFATAEASAQYGTLHGYTIASSNTANDPTYGAARSDAIFGDGFVVQNGPANGTASFAVVFEGNLVNPVRSAFDSSTVTGAWGSLEVSLQQNFVGGALLFDDTIEINRLTQNAVPATGVTATFGNLLNNGNSYEISYNFHFPYQAGKDYFLNLDMNISADKSGTADFLNTGSITNFQVDPAASVAFDSGTSPISYGAPEPASIILLLPAMALLAGRRARSAHKTGVTHCRQRHQ